MGVVIKYVPKVGDSKRAMDEYTADIFMGGVQTIVMHNTCEDSLLATPLILDLAILADMTSRIQYKTAELAEWSDFHPIMSLLSYLIKAPLVPPGTPVVNALFTQRCCIENIFRPAWRCRPPTTWHSSTSAASPRRPSTPPHTRPRSRRRRS